ncbi:hypothetical protein Dimus_036544, partial [Dionaea muscipula]
PLLYRAQIDHRHRSRHRDRSPTTVNHSHHAFVTRPDYSHRHAEFLTITDHLLRRPQRLRCLARFVTTRRRTTNHHDQPCLSRPPCRHREHESRKRRPRLRPPVTVIVATAFARHEHRLRRPENTASTT